VKGRTPSELAAPSARSEPVEGWFVEVDVVEEGFVVDGLVLPAVEICGLVDSGVVGVCTLPTTLPANLIVRMLGAVIAPPPPTKSAAPPA
jgi:hypothetical protein